jgi:GNAT superfamily N-acetyltransferase
MDLTVRKAAAADDLNAIARLLLIADPYVYPPWLGDEAQCVRGLAWLIANSGMFSYRNIFLALMGGGIAGALLYLKKGAAWDPDIGIALMHYLGREPDDAHRQTERCYLNEVVRFNTHAYLLNLGVFEQYRGLGAGLSLMRAFLGEWSDRSVSLEWVDTEAGRPAMALYRKLGFRVTDSYPTFCLYNSGLISFHMRLDRAGAE